MVPLEKLIRQWYEDVHLDLITFSHEILSSPVEEIISLANDVRFQLENERRVGYVVERNINYTNVCVVGCRFCMFHCSPNVKKGFVLSPGDILRKVDDLVQRGGRQVFLQGGINPELPLSWYIDLLQYLKSHFPNIRIHAFSPVEIHFLARQNKMSIEEVLLKLQEGGLDYLPGAGAEILIDRVRNIISPEKISSEEWLLVMRLAHQMGLPTSATMMYGHIETPEERIMHLRKIYLVQKEKPENAPGFLSFIPWPYVGNRTSFGGHKFVAPHTAVSYLKLIALSRLLLQNIPVIQASWLTVGIEVAQMALHAGANDLGSIMIEENVITGGKNLNFPDEEMMQKIIQEAGFIPYRRG